MATALDRDAGRRRVGGGWGLGLCVDSMVNGGILKLGLHSVEWVETLFYRNPIFVLRDDVKYDSFVISCDEDLQVLFHYRRQFPKVRTPKLLAKLVDVVSSSEGVGEAGPLGEVAIAMPHSPTIVSVFGEVGVPDGVEDALHDDDDNDVEPATIADDSDDETPRMTPVVGGGASSSDIEEVVLSMKTYSIRRGVKYKVLESDYCKYYGKCKEFGSGCACLIRVSLHQRKCIWEVKRYNGPYTCLAISISSDHRKLDYHVISAFILPMIRDDAAVSIKVLQNATEAHFGFRPTYRRVWMAKQKSMT
ncbi:uncharacterized protein LOC130934476 [Arachis stenosperma]|uniref:uncharacterized protein LOC130934476 n=1 Tax=Arachis stenosperma TaxID=217475 RepID=UPI0025AD919A|nr:uncharacterized protein LOC130934476 [Arachis stenosperma]